MVGLVQRFANVSISNLAPTVYTAADDSDCDRQKQRKNHREHAPEDKEKISMRRHGLASQDKVGDEESVRRGHGRCRDKLHYSIQQH